MNKHYSVRFNKSLGLYQVASEIAKADVKGQSARLKSGAPIIRSPIFLLRSLSILLTIAGLGLSTSVFAQCNDYGSGLAVQATSGSTCTVAAGDRTNLTALGEEGQATPAVFSALGAGSLIDSTNVVNSMIAAVSGSGLVAEGGGRIELGAAGSSNTISANGEVSKGIYTFGVGSAVNVYSQLILDAATNGFEAFSGSVIKLINQGENEIRAKTGIYAQNSRVEISGNNNLISSGSLDAVQLYSNAVLEMRGVGNRFNGLVNSLFSSNSTANIGGSAVFTGEINVSGGVVNIGNNSTFNSLSGKSAFNVASSAVVTVGSGPSSVNTIDLIQLGSRGVGTRGGGTVVFNGSTIVKSLLPASNNSAVSSSNGGNHVYNGSLDVLGPITSGVLMGSGGAGANGSVATINGLLTVEDAKSVGVSADGAGARPSSVTLNGGATLTLNQQANGVTNSAIRALNNGRIFLNGSSSYALNGTGVSPTGMYVSSGGGIDGRGSAVGPQITLTGNGSSGIRFDKNNTGFIHLADGARIFVSGNASYGVNLVDSVVSAGNFSLGANSSIAVVGDNVSSIAMLGSTYVYDGSTTLDASGINSTLFRVVGVGSKLTINDVVKSANAASASTTYGLSIDSNGSAESTINNAFGGRVIRIAPFVSSASYNTAGTEAGSHIVLDKLATLKFTGNAGLGSLEGASSESIVEWAGTSALNIGLDNPSYSTAKDATYAGRLIDTNANGLIKTGQFNQTFTGVNNAVANVDIQQGQLTFAQSGDFTVTGNLNTASGATLGVGAVDATLKIGGVLTQAAGSRLDAILGASPDITADSAVLDGDLTVSGFSLGAQPVKASEVTQQNYTMIRTVNGITGNFSNINSSDGSFAGSAGLDYLESYGFRSNDLKEYQLGFDLAWTTVNDENRTGSFTMAADSAFDVDIALEDQAPSALTGWDGKTLTKNGEGLLQLSAVNTYTGDTVLRGGVLRLDGAGDISSSSALTVNAGQFDISTAVGNRTVNNLSGTGDSKIALGGNTLTANNAQDATFAGVIEGTAGGFTKAGASTLTLTGDNTYTGITTVDQGSLQLGNGGTTGGVVGDIALNSGTTLVVNRANGLSLAGTFSGQGTLEQVGSGTLTLTGMNSTVGSVDIQQGRLTFAQPGDFIVTGNLNTASGATLGVGATDSTLKIGGVLTQAAGSRLDAILGASPDITADSAVLDGDLTVSGFSLGAQPVKASEVTQQNYTMIRTVNGITGNFSNVNSADGSFVGSAGLDYLESYGFRSNDLKEYQLGFDLAWTTVNDENRTGSFTMAADSAFDVDIALEDQAPSALTGWDGKMLTKNGEGLLQLSALNTYTGDTLLNGGVLKLDGAGDIAGSNALTISGGQFDISSAAGNRTVNNLSGTGGEIMLAGKTLTVNNAQDGTFAGDFDASIGGLVKEGAGALVLSGNTAFTGDTLINAGELTLDGSNGKAQLVSNIIGQTGTHLNLVNGAVLTGTIDPTDVTIDLASVWNMTGTSDVSTMTLAGNINFADPGATLQSGRTLTATNWVGQGGTVNMYAALGGNDSVADKLIIDGGQATGRTNLNIRNAGGLGDQTTGNGINVVQTQNAATTAVDAFALANAEGKVLAGAYEYRLARAGEDWFLQSEQGDVDPGPGPGPDRPVYSPVTSLHTAQAEQALLYAESTVGSLHERMGDLEALNAKTANLAWGRVIGKRVNNDGASDGIYGKDIDSHGDISALQVGNDFYVNAEGKGRTSAGAFLTLGQGDYDVTHAYDANDHITAGANSFDAYSLGGYVTHLNGDGGYVDTVVQVTSFDQTVSPRGLESKSNNAWGVLASVEVGQRIDVGEPEQGLHVEPQAQVIVQTLKQGDSKVVSNVGTESDVSYDRSTTLTSRLGARLSKTWLTADEGAASVWITPSVINTSGDDSQTRFATPTQGDVKLNNQLSGTRASLQLGIDGRVAKGVSVSAMLSGESSLNGENSTAYGGQLGIKIDF